MIKRSATLLTLLGAGLLAGCFLPTSPEVPALMANQFPDDDGGLPGSGGPAVTPTVPSTGQPAAGGAAAPVTTPTEDPFNDSGKFANVTTPTKFEPQFSFDLPALKVGLEPGISTNIYQTKAELEVREVRTLIEGCSFHYEKLKVGNEVGGGTMEIGTPPKMTLQVSVKVESTDGVGSAVLSVKAQNALARVYLADVRIKQNDGNLSIVSISNTSRANDVNGVHTTPASARVVQTIYPGFLILPTTAVPIRSRVIIVSEADPASQVSAQRVIRQTYVVSP